MASESKVTKFEEAQYAAEILLLFQKRFKALNVDNVNTAMEEQSSDDNPVDIECRKNIAVELLAMLISLPESSKLGVRRGLIQWMTEIQEAIIKPSTISSLLEAVMRAEAGFASFDIWTKVNKHFGNNNTNITFRFLDLPAELRTLIYKHYFHLETEEDNVITAYRQTPRGRNRLGLLGVNRFVYNEGRHYLYSGYTMQFNHVPDVHKFLSGCMSPNCQHIRSLHIYGISNELVNTVARLLSRFKELQDLKLVATPFYMGSASFKEVRRFRKRHIYPEYRKRLHAAINRVFKHSVRHKKTPILTLLGFEESMSHDAVFPEAWKSTIAWKS
ncbi:hypothetical protein BDV25DRAFT_136429 [Aspergillus avenaceus]|uniref:Uncharacterized protein n=1 Tax=Aspergillus avenaceus TaxID=36643 RepID=A0A5N6U5E6_ASPAV|nr:hypothetical protein BDV25DRAFT_136429 [Aspergillus avenaceus]